MLAIDGSFLDFKQLDLLALRQSAIHRLDPRAKLLTTLGFIVCVVSFGKYEISAMLPFLIYPVALIAVGDLPPGYILRKILFVLPFALLVGLFNQEIDYERQRAEHHRKTRPPATLEQGQVDRGKAAAASEPRVVDPNQDADGRPHP